MTKEKKVKASVAKLRVNRYTYPNGIVFASVEVVAGKVLVDTRSTVLSHGSNLPEMNKVHKKVVKTRIWRRRYVCIRGRLCTHTNRKFEVKSCLDENNSRKKGPESPLFLQKLKKYLGRMVGREIEPESPGRLAREKDTLSKSVQSSRFLSFCMRLIKQELDSEGYNSRNLMVNCNYEYG